MKTEAENAYSFGSSPARSVPSTSSLFMWRRSQQTGFHKSSRWPYFKKLHSTACRERYMQDLRSQVYLFLSEAALSEVCMEWGYGAVFNLEFSLDGKVLVAACEDNAMQFYDPLSMKHIRCIPNAHSDCVNCVRFLDSRTFATGSDDCTVALWDLRNMTKKVSELKGHKNWVKSIEYSQQTGQLITSAFDGKVYAWNINSFHEDNMQHEELLSIDRLMRTRLTPDGTKMVLSTSLGYYMIIHDLDLTTLRSDLESFKSDEYYSLLQEKQHKELRDHPWNHIFHRKRNRVEIVMDFPEESYPWCISSLIIHPQGWCMMSRFTSEMEDAEWTCVHDIQDTSLDFHKHPYGTRNLEKSPFEPKDRLLYFTSEPNDGRGYIKELSVSPDGRLICSSFGFGVRLLAFDERCNELCDIKPTTGQPKELKQIRLLLSHRRTVVTSEFSPTHSILVTACLNGRVVFHQTRL